MKQKNYLLWKTEKVPLPVVYHLNQAAGALTHRTGRNLKYGERLSIKNAGFQQSATRSPDSFGRHCKYRKNFRNMQIFRSEIS